MLTDWINITRVKISGAERLYPQTIDWKLSRGVNAVIGGTTLGKTTLIYALQFGIFGKMVADTGERIEREFFKDRLTNRSEEQIRHTPPIIEVQFGAGGSSFTVKRNLLNGALVEVNCEGVPLKSAKYEATLAENVGLINDFPSLVQLQSYLLFFGESRYLLAWENLLQNKILNLMFSDQDTYGRLNKLWDKAKSADSEARNISAQASRLQSDLEAVGDISSGVEQLERATSLKEITDKIEMFVAQIASMQKELTHEQKLLGTQDAEIAQAYSKFHRALDQLETEVSDDLDDELLSMAALTPTIASVRHALEQFYLQPKSRPCPCCGRPGLSTVVVKLVEVAAASTQAGHCIICSKNLAPAVQSTRTERPHSDKATDAKAEELRALIFKREQTRSRIESLLKEEAAAVNELAKARAAEIKFLHENPPSPVNPLRVTIDQLRNRERSAVSEREKYAAQLRKELEMTNAVFEGIQSKMVEAFKKYATLYLDEPCNVVFLKEDGLPSKRGPQIKAPHAAFFPVISDSIRPSAQALSDAQRSFIDLAFRMAVLDVWHQQTGKTVTMIVETPEGAVDIAYMERVATMLRTFGNQGHTLIITTNLNNDIFLPEIMSAHPKKERADHMLNLLQRGHPHDVQKTPINMKRFKKILDAVYNHTVTQ
jgi:hypothetical protein